MPVSPFFSNIGVRASGASGMTQGQMTTSTTTSQMAQQGTATIPHTTTLPVTPSGTLPQKP